MLSNKLAAKIRSSVPRPAPSVIEDMGALAPAPLISGANAPDNSMRDSAGAGPQTELLTPRTTGAKRPDVLRGMESVHIWLRSERRETRTTLGTRCCAWPRRPETGGRTDPSKEKRGGGRRCNADTDYLGIGIFCGLVHICTRINSDSRLSRYRHFLRTRAYLHSYKFR